MRRSHRFVFLGGDVEVLQVGPDSFEDVVADPATGGTITAKNLTGNVWITLPGQKTSYETSTPWPSAGVGLVELGPAVLQALENVDEDRGNDVLRALRVQVEEFLAAASEHEDLSDG